MLNELEDVKNIYNYIDVKISETIKQLNSISDDDKFEESKNEVLYLIDNFKKNLFDKSLRELKENQEWNKYTIAFYGETNAGKSTIIETLRLYFKEEQKYLQIGKYQEISFKYLNNITTTNSKLKYVESEIENSSRFIKQITEEFSDKSKRLQSQIDGLILEDSNKKKDSIFYRILSYLRVININKKIGKINDEIQNLKQKYESDLNFYKENLKNLQLEADELKKELKIINDSFIDSLKPYTDGQIIGDGRSDFTKKTQFYNFEYDSLKFSLLDLPGIEGEEEKVIHEISTALKKSHAVFYVTSSPTPPQKGDKNGKGTLEKIKQHLNAHTEVYVIYNKRVTNPKQLNLALINDDEKESLQILQNKIGEILGDNFKGIKIISAKVAFLSLAECLLPNSLFYNEREKFLSNFEVSDLIEKSNLNDLCKFITNSLLVNTEHKIKKANYNKAYCLVEELKNILDKALKDNFYPLYNDVKKEVEYVSINLNSLKGKLRSDLENIFESQIRNFISKVRQDIYRYINRNVSDESVEAKLENLLKVNSESLGDNIKQNIEDLLLNYNQLITETLKNFERRINLALSYHRSLNFNHFGTDFVIELSIDNGIDKMGLLLSSVGAYVTYTIMVSNLWNPIGWVMLATTLVGLYKSVRKFFDDDYKKAQQRQAVDESLDDIYDDLYEHSQNEIKRIYNEIVMSIDKLIVQTNGLVEIRERTNKYLEKTIKELNELSLKIEKIGGLNE